MDLDRAKSKLDHVIDIGRVEMYKPIQVAEVLFAARSGAGIDLSDVESYRTKSRRWRDDVTLRLFGKKSTSSARFQDDLWNESAVPPQAMVLLERENASSKIVEAYIYGFITEKNYEISEARSVLLNLRQLRELTGLLDRFDSPGLVSSADRLYEIFTASVFRTELSMSSYKVSIENFAFGGASRSVDLVVSLVSGQASPLVVDRLGHTNAADGGLDIWTNFGVAISVKRRVLTSQLLEQIMNDTPIGALHIVCLDLDSSAKSELKKLNDSGARVSVTTLKSLLKSADTLLSDPVSAAFFVETLVEAFDREFPMARTLTDFILERGYDQVPLTGRWKMPS